MLAGRAEAGWKVNTPVGVESEWKHGQETYSGQLSDFPRSIERQTAPLEAEGETPGNTVIAKERIYAPNKECTIIEIVKKNGCYEVLEDGIQLPASGYSRDQRVALYTYSRLSQDLVNEATFGDIMDYARRSLETLTERVLQEVEGLANSDETSLGQLHYTIGRAKHSVVGETQNERIEGIGPLIIRVRVEDGELSPDECTLNLRSNSIDGLGDTFNLPNVVSRQLVIDEADVPISFATESTSKVLVVPYPVSVALVPSISLIDRSRAQNEAQKLLAEAPNDSNKATNPFISDPKRTRDPIGLFWELTGGAVADITVGVLGFAARRIAQRLKSPNRAEIREVDEVEFVYGTVEMNVFEDVLYDLNAIVSAWQRAQGIAGYDQRFGVAARVLSPRQRSLVHLLKTRRDNVKYVTPGRIMGVNDNSFKAAGVDLPTSVLNEPDASGLRKDQQFKTRADLYVDLSIKDPMFDKEVLMTLSPSLEHAVQAGRVACELSSLKNSYEKMITWIQVNTTFLTGALKEFIPTHRTKQEKYPETAIQYTNQGRDKLNEDAVKRHLALLFGITHDGVLPARYIDWDDLPFTKPNELSINPLWNPDQGNNYVSYPATPSEFVNQIDADVVRRTLCQVAQPYRANMPVWNPLDSAESLPNQFQRPLHRMLSSACAFATRSLNDACKEFIERERSAGIDSLDSRESRVVFTDLYKVPLALDAGGLVKNESDGSYFRIPYGLVTLPTSSHLPDAAAMSMRSSLESMFRPGVQLDEVMTGLEEISMDISTYEARNAFAAIVVDELVVSGTDTMQRRDIHHSAVQRAKLRAVNAAALISSLFEKSDAAVPFDDDIIYKLHPDGPTAKLALRYASAWRRVWTGVAVDAGRGVWRSHIKLFAKKLKEQALQKQHPKLLPLLNVQTMWLSERPDMVPERGDVLEKIIEDSERSLIRVFSMVSSFLQQPGTRRFALAALLDSVVSRPILWRVKNSMLPRSDVAVTKIDQGIDAENVVGMAVNHEELLFHWSSRRVETLQSIRLSDAPGSQDTLIEELFAECEIDDNDSNHTKYRRSGIDNCRFYVPVSCSLLPRGRVAVYDETMPMQHVAVDSLLKAQNSMVTTNKPGTATLKQKVIVDMIPLLDGFKPTNPLMIETSLQRGVKLHMPRNAYILDGGKLVDIPPQVELQNVRAIVNAINSLTMTDENEAELSKVHDNRRTLLFATDRIYNAALYALAVFPAQDCSLVIDTDSITDENDDSCGGWPTSTQRTDPKVSLPAHTNPFYHTASTVGDPKSTTPSLVAVASCIALSLLPEDSQIDVSIQSSQVANLALAYTAVAALLPPLAALKDTGAVTVTLGELVSSLVHLSS